MDFFEKLRRCASEVNKSKRSQAVGLHPNAISSYITKRSIPRADIAAKIAAALEVPLSWLLDDTQGWPPPSSEGVSSAANLSTGTLTLELARRWRLEQLDAEDAFKRIEPIDWSKLRGELKGNDPGQLSKTTLQKLRLLGDMLSKFERTELRESLALSGDLVHDELASSDGPLPSELRISQLERFTRLAGDEDFKFVTLWVVDHHKQFDLSPASLLGMNMVWKMRDAADRAKALRDLKHPTKMT